MAQDHPSPMDASVDATARGRSFSVGVAGALLLGLAVRLAYVLTDDRWLIGGDGFAYMLDARRIADGLGYTSGIGDVGAQTAHHPPAWVSLLALADWIGARSLLDQQLVGVAIGLGIAVVAAFVGRRYFSPRVGIIAAFLAALYPGFWVLEGNILSEPITIFLIGVFTLVVADLPEHPTLGRSIVVGGLCGLIALARSEQIALLLVVVAPILLFARSLAPTRRIGLFFAASSMCVLVLVPWAAYNATRFEAPVLLSTNGGIALLKGNCATTFHGPLLGFQDPLCKKEAPTPPGGDRSQGSAPARRVALRNMRENATWLPVVAAARVGRMLAVFRPSQTVSLVASWMTTDTTPIWAWVVSYWVLLALAIGGFVRGLRTRRFVLPLVGPLLVSFATVVVVYGEPRLHSASDLGVVVLAAVGVERVGAALRRAQKSAPRPGSTVAAGSRTAATAAQRSVALVGPTNARFTTPSASATRTIGTPEIP